MGGIITIIFLMFFISYYGVIVVDLIYGDFESKKEVKKSLIPFIRWYEHLKELWSELPDK